MQMRFAETRDENSEVDEINVVVVVDDRFLSMKCSPALRVRFRVLICITWRGATHHYVFGVDEKSWRMRDKSKKWRDCVYT